MNTTPIGILDSGLGGLTIWKEVVDQLPHEPTIYIGDSLRTPYGAHSSDEIYAMSKQLVEFLLSKNVKAIVLACNTISVSCLDKLRADYPMVPFIGTVPAIKTAANLSQHHRIGILSTTRTAGSEYQANLIREFATDCTVVNQGTDELVPLIEQGKVEGAEIEEALHRALGVFEDQHIDALVLGCTHFPLVRSSIQKMLGSAVQVLDSGEAIARQVKRVLEEKKALAADTPKYQLYTTGDPDIMSLLAKKIGEGTIGKDVLVEHTDL